MFRRLLLVAFFLEVGLLLIVIPWSAFWDRNYFSEAVPWLGAVLARNFVRGAISGLGLVNGYVGLAELVAIVSARRRDGDRHDSASDPARSAGRGAV